MARHLLRAVLILAIASKSTAARYSSRIRNLVDVDGEGDRSTRDSFERERTLAESGPDINLQVPDDLFDANCPTCKAFGWGDSHTVTFDGLPYDVHVKGELTLVKSLSSDFTIQGRTQAIKSDLNGKGPAVTTGVVVHEDSRLGLPVVQVSMGNDANSEAATMFGNCPVQLFVNNNATSIKDGTGSADATVQAKGKRIVIEYPSTNLRLDMEVREWNGSDCHLVVSYHLADCRCDDTLVGLLGQPDFPKDWTNDWHQPTNGVAVTIPKRLSDRRGVMAYYYALNWCLGAPDSKFAYETGMSHDNFDYCSWGKGGASNYDIDIQTQIETAGETALSKCTMNGELDVGCIVDCNLGGEDACNEFVTIAKTLNGQVAAIKEPEIVLKVPETSVSSCPACKAVGWGDPHIITFDGLSYDVHAKGELTFLKSTTSDFEIQARTESIANDPKGPTVTTGVVVHETGQPTIQVSIAKSSSSSMVTMFGQCPVQLYVDEFLVGFATGTGSAGATVQINGDRIVVENTATNVRLDISVRARKNACHLAVTYHLADCRCDETLVGILGQPRGSWENDWHESDGTALGIPSSRRGLLGREAYDYSLSWCVNEANSRFTYEPHMRHSHFDYCTGTKGAENYDIDFDAIRNTADVATVQKCVFNNTVDEGCLMESSFLGEEARDEYLKIFGENNIRYFGSDGAGSEQGSGVSDAAPDFLPFGEGLHQYDPSHIAGLPDTNSGGSGQTAEGGADPFGGSFTDIGGGGGAFGDVTGGTGGDTGAFGDVPGGTGGGGAFGDVPGGTGGSSEALGLPDTGGDTGTFGNVPEISDAGQMPGLPDIGKPAKISDAGSQGDPHFKTWRNEHFEYHGQCDMVLVKGPSFADGLGLDVQIRTKVVRFWSYIKSAAIRIGTDILEIEGSSDTSKSLRYWINMEFQGRVKTVGGFPVAFKNPKGKNQGGTGKKQAVIIDLGSKYPNSKIEIHVWREFLKISFANPSAEAFGDAVGLLGDFRTGETLARDGATALDDFEILGREWQVLPADGMLFHDTEFPQFPSECIEPEDPRGAGHRRLDESAVSAEDAERACAGLADELDRKDCAYDVLATQDAGMAGAY